ncbi:DNA polymerase [Methanoregula sp.]|jgi:hypothetical protein|uniref:DNA polymerase n=1 Tax=Methanoregula sp. TaxID=2052170 RepID=UPI003C252620
MTVPADCQSIWVVDFEYTSNPGERPNPVCLVARELRSGKTENIWLEGENSGDLKSPPYSPGKDAIFISFYAPAEMSCHLALGWQMPANLVDLFAEHRVQTNGLLGVGNSLLAACEYRGVPSIPSSDHKEQMRNLVLAGGPYSESDRRSILDYCAEDVRLTTDLFLKMQHAIDWPRALFRGIYQESIARMEYRGIPIDTVTLNRLRQHWQGLQARLVKEIDADYGVYDGLTFKTAEFERYLSEKDIPWHRTETGRLSLSYDVFKDMTTTYPFLQGLKDLRHILGAMKLNDLAVGADGRNRTMLSPFRSKTGRNQPSSAKYIFGPAVWLRSLIQPEPGKALIYADYAQQEFAIAGYLSEDSAMQAAYASTDPYLSFAKMAGAAPQDATKESHKAVRDLYKICALGVQFGMGEQSLARQMNRPPAYAGELLRQHRRVFKTYWDWSDRVLNDALLTRRMTTSFGWQFHIAGDGGDASRSIRNWQMQSTGADILRMASVLLERNGIDVVGPVHDAVLLECPVEDADNVAEKAVAVMEKASSYVLGEQRVVRVDYDIIRYPYRYSDPRGIETWNRVTRLLDEIDAEAGTQ